MKNLMKKHAVILLGSLAGTCLMATVAFGNPSMLPDHPGHPMKPLKSPVTGQSLANDPGRNLYTGHKALVEASEAGNERMKLRSREALEEASEKSEKSKKSN